MSKLKQLLFSLNENDRKVIEEKLKTQDQQIDQLKQQLAEKDKEIERLNTIKNNAIECADLFKVALSVRQKDLAIQELEKVRDYAWFNYEKFRNYLNQQIKELRGEL